MYDKHTYLNEQREAYERWWEKLTRIVPRSPSQEYPAVKSQAGQIRTEYVQAPPISIPAHLLAGCLPPVIPDMMTWSDSFILNEQLHDGY